MSNRATSGLLYRSVRLLFGLLTLVCCSSHAVELSERQAKLMTNNCVQCHARPDIGVPLMGNPVDWAVRNKQGMERLLTNVIYGVGGMPPLGYCSACNEDDFRNLIKVMSGIGEGGT